MTNWFRTGTLAFFFLAAAISARTQEKPAYLDPASPVGTRAADLLGRLTPEEKISLLGYRSKAIPRLGIPEYIWWSEALHGVARAGKATVFPQAIGVAASFDEGLLRECAAAISTEARAKYNLSVAKNHRLMYMGLTFWSPNINLFRDPRWGRGQETYGEDPWLTGTMGAAFVRGIQGDDPLHLKAAACAKHYAVHSGPESERHSFNAVVDEKDLRETYLPAFKRLVDSGVEAVMCAYTEVNGAPCCVNQTLLHTILHQEWKFPGHIVTDCGALQDVYLGHKAFPGPVETAAAAIRAGVSLDCSPLLQEDAMKAVNQKLLALRDIDSAVAPLLRTEVKLGFFDPAGSSPWAGYGVDSVANDYHRALSRRMAAESMVLLKNDNHLLPLDQDKYNAYMVVGPNAVSYDALVGSYHGVSDRAVNFVEGITAAIRPENRIEYDMGCDYHDTLHFGGIWAATNADITIAVLGLTPVYEGEEGDAFLAEGGADRKSLSIPAAHLAYLKALRKGTRTPLVVVITAGSAIDIGEIAPYADAIVLAWYPGEQGGNALADILFGKASPSGRLPVTFYRSLADVPDYRDYAMKGRTYRYLTAPPAYPFGFGLSYTDFSYRWAEQPRVSKDSVIFAATITNTGSRDGDEVAQVYVRYPKGPGMPVTELKAFRRVSLATGKQAILHFAIPMREIRKWNPEKHAWTIYPGDYTISVGGNSAEGKLSAPFRPEKK